MDSFGTNNDLKFPAEIMIPTGDINETYKCITENQVVALLRLFLQVHHCSWCLIFQKAGHGKSAKIYHCETLFGSSLDLSVLVLSILIPCCINYKREDKYLVSYCSEQRPTMFSLQAEVIQRQPGRRQTAQLSSHDTGNTDCTSNHKNRE